MGWFIAAGIIVLLAVIRILFDFFHRDDPILRNFPLVGHGRNLMASLGPKLRQYIVAGNDEERPFTRDQRHWIYRSSEKKNNYFGFGTDNSIDTTPGYLIIKHSSFPVADIQKDDPQFNNHFPIPVAKELGSFRNRKRAFRPESIINTSAMSFGSLSSAAVEAISRGCRIAGCIQNTGEGGIAPHHDHGSDLIWQIGTGYYGCRDANGGFSIDRFLEAVERFPVRAIEVKLSQGAKPGKGGVLPSAKITSEISQIRGIPMGRDCLSPAAHSAFTDVDSMLDFVEMLAERSGLPIGIKSAVGQMDFWSDLTRQMASTSRGVDFVTIDGGEGGTGAAPLVFTDHVALPFTIAFSRVYRKFYEAELQDKVVFCGSGKLGFPQSALFAFALGCDMIAVGREAMMAVGCIQAQECHTGFCPTGVATQKKRLMRGLRPGVKSHHFANYILNLRKEILDLSRACGVVHPALITTDHFEILNAGQHSMSVKEYFDLPADSRVPGIDDRSAIDRLMRN